MNEQKKTSFFVTIIALGIFITIFGPFLEVLVGIIIISIIAALIYFIYKFLKQQQQKDTDTTTTFIDETEKQHQDYLFYSNFIKNNTLQEPTPKHVPEVPSVVSFKFENTVDSFDKNFLEVFAHAETYNTIQSQNKFLDSYFKVLAAEDLDTDVETRANHAKEYVNYVQENKKLFHFLKANQTGYDRNSYYFFMNLKETTEFENSMNGHDFEEYCANSLRWDGFNSVEITKASGDQGLDIIAYKHEIKYGIQCKLYSKPVGNSAIQEAYAGKTFYNCHIGIVLTNSTFTASAKQLANKLNIVLWDKDTLKKLQSKINKERICPK